MKDQDLLRCPLLQGLDPMHRAELMGLLNDSGVREKLEKCLAEHTNAADSSKSWRVPKGSPGSLKRKPTAGTLNAPSGTEVQRSEALARKARKRQDSLADVTEITVGCALCPSRFEH